ncbi:MAG TPA: sulfotransferase, partial [Acidobacteriota bacterium]|nr:sulfotransferase [Acidobacteriota bacterium]
TTLLQRIVDAHSATAVCPEIFWITHNVNSRKGPDLNGPIDASIVSELLRHRRFAELGIDPENLTRLVDGSSAVSCRKFLEGVFELHGKSQRKQMVGNKTPQYVQNILQFHNHWPNTKFIHLIRDGRDVCLSILNWKKADRTAGRFATWLDDPVVTTALWWKRNVQLGREAGKSLHPRLYCEIRYEALVADPEGECRRLCDFLEIEFDPRMIHHHEARSKDEVHPNAKSWKPITAGLRDWRTQMSQEQIEKFEAAAGDLLSELSYPRAFPNPSLQNRKHISALFDRFTSDVRSTGKLLPAQWELAN